MPVKCGGRVLFQAAFSFVMEDRQIEQAHAHFFIRSGLIGFERFLLVLGHAEAVFMEIPEFVIGGKFVFGDGLAVEIEGFFRIFFDTAAGFIQAAEGHDGLTGPHPDGFLEKGKAAVHIRFEAVAGNEPAAVFHQRRQVAGLDGLFHQGEGLFGLGFGQLGLVADHQGQRPGGIRVATGGGALEPDPGLVGILGDPGGGNAIKIKLAHGGLGGGIAGVGEVFHHGHRFGGIAAAGELEQTEVVFGGGISRVS